MGLAACFRLGGSLILLIAAGCGPNLDAEWAGSGTAPSVAAKPAAPPLPPQRLPGWRSIAELARVELGPEAERPVSLGHGGGRYTYSIQAPADVHGRYLRPVRDTRFPLDTAILQRTFDAKSGDVGPLFVMLKRQGGWEFHELDAGGFIQRGDEERCRRCHAEARADSVFGAPASR